MDCIKRNLELVLIIALPVGSILGAVVQTLYGA
jgi:hypothetical protein